MQKKLISVGMEVAVYVDGLQEPQTIETYGKQCVMQHAFTVRGVPTEGRRSDAYIVKATVVALDQRRPTRGGYRYSTEQNGVRVEFAEPYEIRSWPRMGGEYKKVKTAVLDTKHILEPWTTTEERRTATEAARIEHTRKTNAAAEAFKPELDAAVKLFAAAGLSPNVTDISLDFEGGSVPLAIARPSHTDRTTKIIGWSWQKCEIKRETLFKLVGSAS